MPFVHKLGCDSCGFSLPEGWGGQMYVKNDAGEKIICPHPNESSLVSRVLGLKEEDVFLWLSGKKEEIKDSDIVEVLEERTGFNSFCICLDCLHQFTLDLEKEERGCSECGSEDIKSEREMVDKPCPKCKKGIMKIKSKGAVS